MSAQIKLRRDTAANWTSVNPILSSNTGGIGVSGNAYIGGNAFIGGIHIKSLALALAAAMS
jgi:hypothetical protein